jgi:hypothetical protein
VIFICLMLFDEEDKVTKEDRKRRYLFYLLKDSIVTTIVVDLLNTYHEGYKTYIRGLSKKCKTIIGDDAMHYIFGL